MLALIFPIVNIAFFLKLAKNDSEENKQKFYQVLLITTVCLIFEEIYACMYRHMSGNCEDKSLPEWRIKYICSSVTLGFEIVYLIALAALNLYFIAITR
jgi:hypothetical protein